ncbi:MAG: copper transporter [Mycobacteriales bacterium]
MISFRSHIVSMVSVFLALAVGVVLGGGPLKGHVDTRLADQVQSDRQTRSALQSEVATLRKSGAFDDAFAKTAAPGLIGDRLRGHVVSLVVLPGARQADVSALTGLIGTAGGSVGGTLRAGTPLVEASGKQLVDELGHQLDVRAGQLKIPAGASPYERIGALVARAVATKQRGGARVDTPATTILGAMAAAHLLSARGRLSRQGDLVLFVAGPGRGDASRKQGSASIVTTLVRAVDAGSGGVVLAGPPASAREPGALKAVRADAGTARGVSTVDTVGSAAGQVVTVLALAGQAVGQSGQYGAVGAADGAMPGARQAAD